LRASARPLPSLSRAELRPALVAQKTATEIIGSSQNFGKTAHHGLKPVAIYRQPFRLNDVKTPKQRYFTA
jgi:hypothetical protein